MSREHGVIEQPLQPTLRITAPVFGNQGKHRAAITVNLDAEALQPPRRHAGVDLFMLDQQGAFLRHSDRSLEFGLELGSGVTLQRDYAEAASALDERSVGTEELANGLIDSEPELLAFRQVAYNPADGSHHWLMIVAQPKALVFAPLMSLSADLAAIVLGVTMLACAVGWLLSRRVTKPLSEIAELGTAFQLMTKRLRQTIDLPTPPHRTQHRCKVTPDRDPVSRRRGLGWRCSGRRSPWRRRAGRD